MEQRQGRQSRHVFNLRIRNRAMALSYFPRQGEILICDFSTGFRAPEMVKKRPVIIISPRARTSRLVTVVPLSSTEPRPVETCHYQLPAGAYPPARSTMWAKCDMINTVSVDRLDRVMTRDAADRRTYTTYHLTTKALQDVMSAVRSALSLT